MQLGNTDVDTAFDFILHHLYFWLAFLSHIIMTSTAHHIKLVLIVHEEQKWSINSQPSLVAGYTTTSGIRKTAEEVSLSLKS